mmetsp:Transcript_15295/g.23034  ORF Transcript_15295/g.23034 Transcript_15295/m.23034 type:complete len:278 (+) Transcript_15295:72-905(+)
MPRYSINLFDIGEMDSCLFSCCCSPCAYALSRTQLDDSPFLYNLFCVPSCPLRWMIRTAYDIHDGDDCTDCIIPTFCYCCSANQIYQTSKRIGRTYQSGRQFNTQEFQTPLGSGSLQDGLYACFCMQCAVGTALQRAVGMPFYLGCCCMTPFAARNVFRYQFHIQGDDMLQECAAPWALQCIGKCLEESFPPIWVMFYPIYVLVTLQLLSESHLHQERSNGYLSGYSVIPTRNEEPVIAQPISHQQLFTEPVEGSQNTFGESTVVVPSAPPAHPYEL